jgi:hypothetical protein
LFALKTNAARGKIRLSSEQKKRIRTNWNGFIRSEFTKLKIDWRIFGVFWLEVKGNDFPAG